MDPIVGETSPLSVSTSFPLDSPEVFIINCLLDRSFVSFVGLCVAGLLRILFVYACAPTYNPDWLIEADVT
jgi:hypothetical protein